MNDEINLKDNYHTLQFFDTSKISMNIVCNGFDMKETIIEVLHKHIFGNEIYATDSIVDEIAEDLKEVFAVKLGLKQGKI